MKLTSETARRTLPDRGLDGGGWQTIVEALRWRATYQAGRIAFRFLPDGRNESLSISYAQLDAKIRSIAGSLQQNNLIGERVLIFLPIGPEYVFAMLACLYAGAVAVPLPAPRPKRQCDRLRSIWVDAQAKAVLTNVLLRATREVEFEELNRRSDCQVLAIEVCRGPSNWQPKPADPEQIAYLQYTSGSTTTPRGVSITHANTIRNCSAIAVATESESSDLVVSWLPFFHDMGLVGTLFFPLTIGCPLVFMPPDAFIMRPIRWLQAISRYRATLSPAPNFAYDLCVQRTTPEQRQELDLSSWRTAFNGSERISDRSIETFTKMFGPCGFQRETMRPCYGLAEATLMVTCAPVHRPPRISRFDLKSLNSGTAVFDEMGVGVVSCGRPIEMTDVLVVDADTRQVCPDGRLGEIWVAGPCVAAGYWNNRKLTKELLQVRLYERGDIEFLATGDLGFVLDGELYVTGRVKDLIIIDGRNVFPEDLETAAENIHEVLPLGSTIAFSITGPTREQVVLVAAPARNVCAMHELRALEQAIRVKVAAQADVPIGEVIFIHRRDLPKTTSGKKQRRSCRDLFLQGKLPRLMENDDNDG